MRYIGRIITPGKVEGVSDFIEVTKDASSVVGNDTKIPTLIVGYKNAVDICGQLKMTEKRIGKNLFWTFSKRERRIDYEPDLEKFIGRVSDFIMKFCRYEYVDPITWNDEKKSECLDVMTNNSRKVLYMTDSMYYLYYPKTNTVYGMSLDVLKFCELEDSVLETISKESTTMVKSSDFSDTSISKFKFVQPLLYYLRSF